MGQLLLNTPFGIAAVRRRHIPDSRRVLVRMIFLPRAFSMKGYTRVIGIKTADPSENTKNGLRS